VRKGKKEPQASYLINRHSDVFADQFVGRVDVCITSLTQTSIVGLAKDSSLLFTNSTDRNLQKEEGKYECLHEA
jgi:hypothetical protein